MDERGSGRAEDNKRIVVLQVLPVLLICAKTGRGPRRNKIKNGQMTTAATEHEGMVSETGAIGDEWGDHENERAHTREPSKDSSTTADIDSARKNEDI
jgi:hypothetical protein